jgi:hypothetical protein
VNAIKNKLTAAAYHSGTGTSMSLVFTSFYHGCEWDFNLKYDQDFKWYIDESLTQLQRNEKFFVELCGTLAKKYVEFLLLHVKPRRISFSASVAQFLDRMFSLTSSMVDAVVHVISEWILHDNPRLQDYEIVLRFASKLDLLQNDEGEDDELVKVNQDTEENEDDKGASEWAKPLAS